MTQISGGGVEFPVSQWRAFAQNRAVVRCSAGHLIYLQETRATCFYYLKTGRVKSLIQSEQGGERILRTYEAGAIFGAASFFDELPRVSSAVALTACELVPIDRELVEQEFTKDPVLAMSMIRYLSRAVRLLSNQVDDMAFRPAGQRLARHLLAAAEQDGVVHTSQDELASAVSVSRVTVSRVLSDFAAQGLIEVGYRTVTLLRRDELEKECR